jgi:hypothetical protein
MGPQIDTFEQVYDEETFSYFLALEQKRAERAGRPFLLLLVDLNTPQGAARPDVRLHRRTAARLFAELSHCLRETDFVGWYRDRCVAGAVLTQQPGALGTTVAEAVGERVTRALRERLPSNVAPRLNVRVYLVRTTQNVQGVERPWR